MVTIEVCFSVEEKVNVFKNLKFWVTVSIAEYKHPL